MSLPYHRLARTYRLGKYTPWHPFMELILVTVFSLVFMFAFMIAIGVVLFAANYPISESVSLVEIDESDPAVKLLFYGSLGAMIPAPFLAARITGRRPRALWSVVNRFRWGLFGRAALIIAAFHIVTAILDAAVAPGSSLPDFDERTLTTLLVVAAYTPLQCAAEELIYRGSLPQIFGAWIRQPWLAYLLPIPFFVMAHDYDPVGLFFVALFAGFASILVHRTGGLEVAIAYHIGNNVSVEWFELIGFADLDVVDRPSMIFVSELSSWVLFGILLAVFWNYSPPTPEPAPMRPQPGTYYPAGPYPQPPYPQLPHQVPPHQLPPPQLPQPQYLYPQAPQHQQLLQPPYQQVPHPQYPSPVHPQQPEHPQYPPPQPYYR
nr:CAAX amino terminal protease self- immunity [Streptococcus thermophilus]